MGSAGRVAFPVLAAPVLAGSKAPRFAAGEVGNVDASTVVVTFNRGVLASDYATGVTITVAGAGATISSATRQANTAVIYFVLSAPVTAGQVVTFAYNAAVGDYSNLAASKVVATIAAQTLTNNLGGSMAGYAMGVLGLTYSS